MSDYNPGPSSTASPNSALYVRSYSADQVKWESYLSSYGAVFSGSGDDSYAVQEALNAIASDNKIHNVVMPSGGLTCSIGSVNTCPYSDAIAAAAPNCGLQLPSNVGIDFNGMTLAVTTAGAAAIGISGTALALVGNSGIATAYPVHMLRWERGTVSSNGVGYSLIMSNNVADRGPDRATIRNMWFHGAYNGVWILNTAYLIHFYDCLFQCTGGGTRGTNLLINGNLSGEGIGVYGSTFAGDSSAAYVTGILQQTQSDVYVYNSSFDFVSIAVWMNAVAEMSCSLYGCHLEFATSSPNWSATQGYLQISANTPAPQAINMFGGWILQDPGGTGQQLSYVCNPQNPNMNTPTGITLDRVQRYLQSGTVLNNTGATGRFVDNP